MEVKSEAVKSTIIIINLAIFITATVSIKCEVHSFKDPNGSSYIHNSLWENKTMNTYRYLGENYPRIFFKNSGVYITVNILNPSE